MKKLFTLKSKKGFTLVELIVVIAIIAVLVAIAVPAMTGYIGDAKKATAQSNCRTVVSAASAVNASLLAEVDKTSWGTQMNKLLGVPDGADISKSFGTFGGGNYTITLETSGAVANNMADGGTIQTVTWYGNGATATWDATTNEMTSGKYTPPSNP